MGGWENKNDRMRKGKMRRGKEKGEKKWDIHISVVTRGKEILREFTSVQHDTREPKFDKTFYIPLELVQISSRLIIHLNRQTGKRFDDVIGCMSFGMKTMISSSKCKR
ncbi:regulator of G-protein signaling 3-like [Lytechinus pictus]|uniref:regulator of G-protein signaling 3-like n=1 Tax=Lytechinus pictus TaxID=7653 RepID=UPI0030B9B044